MKNAKNGASLGAIIGVAFAFMTTFFGGGWATGAQTGAYATQHGWTAIWAREHREFHTAPPDGFLIARVHDTLGDHLINDRASPVRDDGKEDNRKED